MKLEFDSIDDLKHFLHWAGRYGEMARPALPTTVINVAGTADADDPLPTIDTSGIAFDTPPATALTDAVWPAGGAQAPASEVPELVNAAGKPARKRRTKAEIEADEKAVAAAAEAKAAGDHVDVSRTVNADGTVSTISVGLPPDVNPSDVTAAEPAAQPEGTNPFEQAATPAAEAAGPAAEPAGGEGDEIVTPFQHLTRARAFIAKHQMPKYNETFTKAGLDPNVMAYTAYQRALHMAAMDEADKA